MCVRQSLKDTLVQHGAEEEELKEATLQLDLAADILLLGSLAKAEAAKANGKGRFAKWQATVAEIVVVRLVCYGASSSPASTVSARSKACNKCGACGFFRLAEHRRSGRMPPASASQSWPLHSKPPVRGASMLLQIWLRRRTRAMASGLE